MLRDYCVDIKLLSLFRSDRSGTSRSVRAKVTAPPLRQTYGLSVVCHVSDAEATEAALKGMFEHYGLTPHSLRRDPVSMKFVRLTALVESSIVERVHLVWIVNQLAAMPSIRHVHWETRPHLRRSPAG